MSSGSIPCTGRDLWVIYTNVENLLPPEKKTSEYRAKLAATGGEAYDEWFAYAERIIVRDLLKFGKPLTLNDFADLSDLMQLKAFKTLEILFRLNFKAEGDKFHIDSEYYGSQYAQELETIPMRTIDGAIYSPGGGLTRRS